MDRSDRQSGARALPDQRAGSQLDRDRILYSAALRRLAGVTQVVSPTEGEVFHSRLTHTLKVAQLSRRLAEKFLEEDRKNKTALANGWGGIDPEVVEAAALAHDLGHPPFGHIAEEELDRQIKEAVSRSTPRKGKAKVPTENDLNKFEGYEGNAQSFRIITKLGIRGQTGSHGLDLSRATLDAALKYPWLWKKTERKYGAYTSETEEFCFARGQHNKSDRTPSIEAQIMDWADDIAYSVHDTEDFYRAGLIPLDRLAVNPKERDYFRGQALDRRAKVGKPLELDKELLESLSRFFDRINLSEPYRGTLSQRQSLYDFTSQTIRDYVTGTRLRKHPGGSEGGLEIDPAYRVEVDLLKELTWCYVINNPALAAHQHGQRLAIRTLFEVFDTAALKERWELFPPIFREMGIEQSEGKDWTPARRVRLVADTIASLNDQQALRMHQRLTGQTLGSIFDPIMS